MAQVFVSYAQKDMVEARRILEALEQAGLSVFRETSLAAGVSWADDVRHQIDIAKCVVVLWSQAAAESQFVQQEIAQAIQAWSDGRLVLAVLDEPSCRAASGTCQPPGSSAMPTSVTWQTWLNK
jgi:hypothetical protein